MNNGIRFLIGLGIFFVLLIVGIILFIVLSPLLLIGGFLLGSIISAGLTLFAIATFFGFIWYLSRKEPELENKNVDFSINQGKAVK